MFALKASSYARGGSETPLLEETIGANLARVASNVPDRDALIVRQQNIRLTYAELDAAVDDVAAGLLALELQPGDRLGIWSPNCAEWVLIQYATARIGVILVNINPAYRRAELAFALQQSGARVLVSATSFKTSDYREILEDVASQADELRNIVYPDRRLDGLIERGRALDLQTVREREARLRFHEPINIQYTSGTTGSPKGATLTHHNILNNGYFVGERCGYTEVDRVCIPVPFYHCFGMVLGNLACTTHGSCIVVPDYGFDPVSVLTAVEAEECTSLYGVPTMFIAELEHPEFERFDLSSLRTGIMAGSPCPVEVMRKSSRGCTYTRSPSATE